MNAEGAQGQALPTEASWDPRASLTRALAAESRNALARIELAASEIARFGPVPSLALRLDAIHSAVAEIDGLLGRLDVVARLRPAGATESSAVGPVAHRVLARIAPALRTRGLVLERSVGLADAAGPAVPMPEPVVESIVLGLVGALASLCEAPARLALGVAVQDEEVEIEGRLLEAAAWSGAGARDEALQLDLGVEISEWGGRLVVDRDGGRLVARLPRSGGEPIARGGAVDVPRA